MTDESHRPRDPSSCPNCGASVVYAGVGRRPIWCSTRCRNDASLKRLGARKAAVEVRVVEVFRQRNTSARPPSESPSELADRKARSGPASGPRAPTPTADQALRVIRNDPDAVGKLLSYLERRRADGTLNRPEWLPVRNGFRLIASALPPGLERPN